MGVGLLFWSWLSFGLPTGQNQIVAQVQQSASQNQIEGTASYYHTKFVGRLTSTGEVFSNEKFTAASNKFELGTYVKVTNKRNGKFIYVKVNDRMGHPGRVIDLTERAAKALGYKNRGLTKVVIEPVSKVVGKNGVIAQLEENKPAQDNPDLF